MIKFLRVFLRSIRQAINLRDIREHYNSQVWAMTYDGTTDGKLSVRERCRAALYVFDMRASAFVGMLLRPVMRRSEWTANPADPTVVVRWVGRYLTVTDCTWAVSGRLHWGTYTLLESADSAWATAILRALEDAELVTAQMADMPKFHGQEL